MERADDGPAGAGAGEEGPSSEDFEAALVVLATLADVLADTGGPPLERLADAVDLLERLLPDARLSPARYRAVVAAPTPGVASALAAVWGAARAEAGGGPGASARDPRADGRGAPARRR
ncbi:MAG: hypothetical protein R3B70_16435 [Polyangiaceae bacterium]